MNRHQHRLRQSGQAAVETAIVMPMFVFLILGLLQLGLMHQARVMTKFAAFKAVRVGVIHNAKQSAMRRAALATLLPVTARRKSPNSFYNATVGNYALSWGQAKATVDQTGINAPFKLIICEPVGTNDGDFDDPDGTMGGTEWQTMGRGRLSIQITNYYQLVIPFANAVIFNILSKKEKAEFYTILRMRPKGDVRHKDWLSTRNAANGDSRTIDAFEGLATQGIYVIPIRAGWAMRMHSNFLSGAGADYQLPQQNFCRVPWAVQGGSGPQAGKD